MKLFLDEEFTGLHQNTKLISIGIVDEDNNTFYAESCDFMTGYINDEDRQWAKENIIPNLMFYGKDHKGYNDVCLNHNRTEVFGEITVIRDALMEWLNNGSYKRYEIWSDCLAYDWVLFCQLFGHAFNVPSNVYYIPFDICTMMRMKGIDPDISREEFAFESFENIEHFRKMVNIDFGKHNSLWDALVIKECYNKLQCMDTRS